MGAEDVAMPIYLFIASIFNAVFLHRATRDCLSSGSAVNGSVAVALVLTAISEFTWVLPCFVQCFLVLVLGHEGEWAPEHEDEIGCKLQGFYSQFGSLSGMMSSLVLALLTLQIARERALPHTSQMWIIAGCVFVVAFVVSVLPFVGAGRYSYSGEGFCYIDWYDTASSAIMLTFVLPIFAAVIATDGALLLHKWPSNTLTAAMCVAFVSAWCLWIPAAFIGLSGGSFPGGYMISGAVLGHAQAIVNPLLYGVWWRRALLKQHPGEGFKRSVKDSSALDAAA